MPYPSQKKMLCRVAPLAFTGLKRMPVQAYYGRVLGELPLDKHGSPGYVFGTPHGLLIAVKPEQLEELSADQYRALDALEELATLQKKNLYGGQPGLTEFTVLSQRLR